jgi:hypothetical protein
MVLDIDGAKGLATMRTLPAVEAPYVKTGRADSGYHLLFTCPPGLLPGRVGFLPGLDARVESKNYLVGPGSRHASGNLYEWGSDPSEFLNPPPLPQFLIDAILAGGAGSAPVAAAPPVDVAPVDMSVITEALTGIKNTHRNIEYRDIARNVLEGGPFAIAGQGADDKMNGFAGVIVGKLPATVPLQAIVEACRRSLGSIEGGQGAAAECEKFLEKLTRARTRVEAKRAEKAALDYACAEATKKARERLGKRKLYPIETPAFPDEAPTRRSMLIEGLPVQAYVLPWNRYVPLRFNPGARWVVEDAMVKEAAAAELGADIDIAKAAHPDRPDFWDLRTLPNHPLVVHVDGVQRVPDGAFTCKVDGRTVLNVWSPPAVQPREGTWENIQRLLRYLTGEDPEALEWLLDLLAAKYQKPGSPLPCAPLFHGPPGTGKTSLFRIVSELWGPANVALVDQATLESDFNATHADKLWVLADDCFPAGSKRDMASVLKTLITGDTVMVNEKGIKRYSQKNRRAIMFAANRLDALLVEVDDRRLSIFSSPKTLTDSWRSYVMKTFWTPGILNTPTKLFWGEMSAFAHALRARAVGTRHVLPYANEPRERVIAAGMSSAQAFIEAVQLRGLAALVEEFGGSALVQADEKKRFGPAGCHARYLFDIYRVFCEAGNMRPVTSTSFGLVVSSVWDKRKVGGFNMYAVPETKPA